MSYSFNNTTVKNITYNGQTVKKWNHNNVLVYSSSIAVTYYVESSTKYTEEVASGDSCLSPKTFTPSKSGYTFIGWREDKAASSSVLTSKVMGDSPITLYAVFRKTITLSIRISGAATTQTGYQYYNNSTVANPTFTVANPTKSGSTFLGWSTASTSTTATYSSISNRAFSANTTIYSIFKAADTTVSPTTAQLVGNTKWFTGAQTIGTFYSAVDTSKYYAAQLTLTLANCTCLYRGKQVQFYISDGTNKTRIVYAYTDWTGNDGNGQRYPNQGQNFNPTLTFSTSSGSKPIYLTSILSVYGSSEPCASNDGANVDYNIIVSSIKLLARTVVG